MRMQFNYRISANPSFEPLAQIAHSAKNETDGIQFTNSGVSESDQASNTETRFNPTSDDPISVYQEYTAQTKLPAPPHPLIKISFDSFDLSRHNNAFFDGTHLVFGSGDGAEFSTRLDSDVLAWETAKRDREHRDRMSRQNLIIHAAREKPEIFFGMVLRAIQTSNPDLASAIRQTLFSSGKQWQKFLETWNQKKEAQAPLPEGVTYEELLGKIEELAAKQRLDDFLSISKGEFSSKENWLKLVYMYTGQTLSYVFAIEHALAQGDAGLASLILEVRQNTHDGCWGSPNDMSTRDTADCLLANRIFGWKNRTTFTLTAPEHFAVSQVWAKIEELATKATCNE